MSMGFSINEEEKVTYNPIVPENFTSSICYGRTGSGKTTGFILPNIENRISLGHGILVYDYKGNQHEQVKYLAQKANKLNDVFEIGTQWGEKINILDNTNEKLLRNMLMSNLETHDKYWSNAAINLFLNLYNLIGGFENFFEYAMEIQEDIIEYHLQEDFFQQYFSNPSAYLLSIKKIFDAVKSIGNMEKFITKTSEDIESMKLFAKYALALYQELGYDINKIKKLFLALNDIEKYFDNLSEYHMISNTEDSVNGKFGVLGVLGSILSNFGAAEYLNNSKFDIVDALMDSKIVVINCLDIDELSLIMINSVIYTQLQKKLFYKNAADISIFIDEAHKILHRDYLPSVDTCRESKFEYILSTQDELLLRNKLGKDRCEELLRNIVTQFSFVTNLNESLYDTHKLKKFEYLNFENKRTYLANRILLDTDVLFEVEHTYQKNRNIFDIVINKPKGRFILKELGNISKKNKAYIYIEDTQNISLVDTIDKNFDLTKFDTLLESDRNYILAKIATVEFDREKQNEIIETSRNNPKWLSQVEIFEKYADMSEVAKRITPLEEEFENLETTTKNCNIATNTINRKLTIFESELKKAEKKIKKMDISDEK